LPTRISGSQARKSLKLKDGQTKLDRWLEQMQVEQKTLVFYFSIPPIPPNPGRLAPLSAECTVIEVDRDMLFLEFHDGQCWWINREVITAVGWPM
jgi:hypothetical protein